MICDGFTNKQVDVNDAPDFNPGEAGTPIDVVTTAQPDDKDNSEDQKQSKSPKDDERSRSPVIQTDLSNSIMDFDLEKELAISIRGRCGRKSKRISERKKAHQVKKEGEDDNEEDSVNVHDEEPPEVEEVEDDEDEVKKEEQSGDDDDVKKENESDEEDDVDTKGAIKMDDNDVTNSDLNVCEYLAGGLYEPPSLKNFELIVDSIESLKELVDKLIKEEDLPVKECGRGRNKVCITRLVIPRVREKSLSIMAVP